MPTVAVVIAAAVTLSLVLHGSPGGSTYKLTALQRQQNVARNQAAAWVAEQVSRTTRIACDPPTCAALKDRGFPASHLTDLGSTSQYPLSSALVLQTAYVRSLFGESLGNDYAPSVIATFGSGNAQIAVRVIAPHGAAAYQASLAADLAYRKQAGAALVASSQIAAAALAKAQMTAGLVDTRLMIAITALAAEHPVDIVDFGNLGHGASPGVPLRYADLSEDGAAAHMANSAYLRWMLSVLDALPTAYRALTTETVQQRGVAVLRVEYSAPSPLGVLAPSGGGNSG